MPGEADWRIVHAQTLFIGSGFEPCKPVGVRNMYGSLWFDGAIEQG
jgi:hypothetical protein